MMVALAWVALLSRALVATVIAFGMLILTVFLLFALLRMGQGGSRAAPGGPSGDRTPDACWKWGVLHQSGNRWSWIFLVITLLPLILVNFYLR